MSYQVLARKWRPQRFSEVVGQQHVLSALENGLREQRLHHAYLFSGTRGVGKTSIARLFAKGLNCEKGITANPCGECPHCKAIEEGRFIDLIEIDAASRTKVEDTRELLDNVQYKPTVGRFKVYLIDEVHMLSRHSFNALLKTLEEPPEYVKFLLATTDPQKLPITILSRCMQFHLRALEQVQIRTHLEFVLKQEAIPFELPALEKLAKAAQGSVRDALSLTDQAIAISNANITLQVVSEMLGLIDDHHSLELVQALANADGEKMMSVIQAIAEKGSDWQTLLNDIAETLHRIAMIQLLKNHAEQTTHLHLLAQQISPEDVQFFYQLILTGKQELLITPEPRIGVEMTMLRALAFHPKKIEATLSSSSLLLTQSSSTINPPPTTQDLIKENKVHGGSKDQKESKDQRADKATSNITQLREQLQPTQAVNTAGKTAQETAINAEMSSTTEMPSPAIVAMNARKALQEQRSTLIQSEKKKANSSRNA